MIDSSTEPRYRDFATQTDPDDNELAATNGIAKVIQKGASTLSESKTSGGDAISVVPVPDKTCQGGKGSTEACKK